MFFFRCCCCNFCILCIGATCDRWDDYTMIKFWSLIDFNVSESAWFGFWNNFNLNLSNMYTMLMGRALSNPFVNWMWLILSGFINWELMVSRLKHWTRFLSANTQAWKWKNITMANGDNYTVKSRRVSIEMKII